ncbi:hypothetical protein ACLKA7_001198 [Drosophila subpalustris]
MLRLPDESAEPLLRLKLSYCCCHLKQIFRTSDERHSQAETSTGESTEEMHLFKGIIWHTHCRRQHRFL